MPKREPIKVRRPGALTQKAKRAGMTINAFARKHAKDPGLKGTQSRLYLNIFRPANKRRKKK